ncbi:hypothetical protein FHS96_004117 [Sphingomonas zeicaulis]|uniref:hypothetical protein n=1 Tax=Sphingomonas zeicaulis TaxID=1632740 RepID=UPI003D1D896F
MKHSLTILVRFFGKAHRAAQASGAVVTAGSVALANAMVLQNSASAEVATIRSHVLDVRSMEVSFDVPAVIGR